MVAKINSTSEKEANNGKVKVGKLPRDREPATELTSSEQKQIKGGTLQTKPDSTNVPRPGGGGCDEFGCGGNHNETLVRTLRR